MEKSFDQELAIAAAVWNRFKVLREEAERHERAAKKDFEDARNQENVAFHRFLELAEKATLEPVNLRGQ